MWKQRELLWADAVADPGGFLGYHGTPLFVVLRACIASLVRTYKRSRKRSGQRNPPFRILDPPLGWHKPNEAERWCNYTHFHLAPE